MKRILTCALTLTLAVVLTVPALANFTPSVEAKPAPELVKPTPEVINPAPGEDKPGSGEVDPTPDVVLKEDTIAVIKDSAKCVVEEIPKQELIITPASEKYQAVAEEITDNLVRAEKQIDAVKHLGHLTVEMEQALRQAKQEKKVAHIDEVNIEDLVIRDLFDVSIVREGQVVAIPDGHTITYSIQTDLSDDVLHFVLHNTVNHEWEVLEEAQAMHDGVITVVVDSLSPFAIVVDKEANLDVDPAGPTSPQTGESTSVLFAVGAVALLCAAVVLFGKSSSRARS